MPDDDKRRHYLLFSSERTLQIDEPAPYSGADVAIPISIFSTQLSGLQAVVRHLHETRHYSFAEIARLLNRSQKTIWTTYDAARRMEFAPDDSGLTIPVERFATRQYSPLETIVSYLASLGFSNVDIARRLGLDPRTTWTVKRRAEKKEVHA